MGRGAWAQLCSRPTCSLWFDLASFFQLNWRRRNQAKVFDKSTGAVVINFSTRNGVLISVTSHNLSAPARRRVVMTDRRCSAILKGITPSWRRWRCLFLDAPSERSWEVLRVSCFSVSRLRDDGKRARAGYGCCGSNEGRASRSRGASLARRRRQRRRRAAILLGGSRPTKIVFLRATNSDLEL